MALQNIAGIMLAQAKVLSGQPFDRRTLPPEVVSQGLDCRSMCEAADNVEFLLGSRLISCDGPATRDFQRGWHGGRQTASRQAGVSCVLCLVDEGRRGMHIKLTRTKPAPIGCMANLPVIEKDLAWREFRPACFRQLPKLPFEAKSKSSGGQWLRASTTTLTTGFVNVWIKRNRAG
jgi:hypothetical protein